MRVGAAATILLSACMQTEPLAHDSANYGTWYINLVLFKSWYFSPTSAKSGDGISTLLYKKSPYASFCKCTKNGKKKRSSGSLFESHTEVTTSVQKFSCKLADSWKQIVWGRNLLWATVVFTIPTRIISFNYIFFSFLFSTCKRFISIATIFARKNEFYFVIRSILIANVFARKNDIGIQQVVIWNFIMFSWNRDTRGQICLRKLLISTTTSSTNQRANFFGDFAWDLWFWFMFLLRLLIWLGTNTFVSYYESSILQQWPLVLVLVLTPTYNIFVLLIYILLNFG